MKQVLTEKSKGETSRKISYVINLQLQKECEQFQFQMKKLEKTKKFQQDDLQIILKKKFKVELKK